METMVRILGELISELRLFPQGVQRIHQPTIYVRERNDSSNVSVRSFTAILSHRIDP